MWRGVLKGCGSKWYFDPVGDIGRKRMPLDKQKAGKKRVRESAR